MGRSKKNYIEENVEITGFAAEGKAFGKIKDKIVFVPYAAPGDVIDVRITRNKSSFYEGVIEKVISPSPMRIEPFCNHFGICGGCRWQHIPYEKQLEYKQKQIVDQLKHIGNVIPEVILPIIPSTDTTSYRNKLEFTFSPRGWLTRKQLSEGVVFAPAAGFHIPGQFDKVLDIEKCYLQDEISDMIRHSVKKFVIKKGFTFHNINSHTGLFRTVSVRNTTTCEVMVIVMLHEANDDAIEMLKDSLLSEFKITSLVILINPNFNDSTDGLRPYRIYGSEYITETLDGFKFCIGPLSFFQTNSRQVLNMYRVVKGLCSLSGKETVYDLYSGTGTITNYLAPFALKTIGVEYIAEAAEHARINSEINGIKNTMFVHGDVKNVLTKDFFAENGFPDIIVTDPPRAGMHPDVVETICSSGTKKIVYISCNPATQARDIKLLSENYIVKIIQPVDMFPHTYHVENVALLERIS